MAQVLKLFYFFELNIRQVIFEYFIAPVFLFFPDQYKICNRLWLFTIHQVCKIRISQLVDIITRTTDLYYC